ncbi:hypothetical protein [Catenuloplanes atrovinosus]|uniref:Uncharacterized protein n=1 Tax=Catenuloplanes atrovinosus TaxID=137266 RepID=A0AAE3YQP7_9ACTN|nr:hypothetical protein [Catenuloplanes atrovinosus]MDR7276910.1 hypothetical protein [Catenuloplanes atrovinosus]
MTPDGDTRTRDPRPAQHPDGRDVVLIRLDDRDHRVTLHISGHLRRRPAPGAAGDNP